MSASPRSLRALDGLNFFLADVRDGLGPYLAIYLLTTVRWNEAEIGVVMTIAGVATLLAQTPAGALVDRATFKRGLLIAAAVLVAAACLWMPYAPGFAAVAAGQVVIGVAGAVFPPAIAGITLGLIGRRAFAARFGRNEAFNHGGNAFAALLAGGAGHAFDPVAVFWLVALMAVMSLVTALRLDGREIDHAVYPRRPGLTTKAFVTDFAPIRAKVVRLVTRPSRCPGSATGGARRSRATAIGEAA